MDEKIFVTALSQVLKALADEGWIASTAIRHGRLDINYTDHGKERMRALKRILIEELHIALTYAQHRALTALLVEFEKSPPSAATGPAPV